MATTAKDVQEILMTMLDDGDNVRRIDSFSEAGLLTRDKGVVVSMKDGSEFQISIIQSLRADVESDDDEE